MCAAANFRLGEDEDSDVWSIIEGKYPFEQNFRIINNHPLFHSVLFLLKSARSLSEPYIMLLIDQSSRLLEQSSAYNDCKHEYSQNTMVRARTF